MLDSFKKLWRNIGPWKIPYAVSYLIVCSRNFAINYLTAFLLYETTVAAQQMDVNRLLTGTLFFLAVLLVFIAIDSLGLFLHGITTQKITNRLRHAMYQSVLRAPLWRVEALGTSRGDLLSRLNHDAGEVEDIYRSSLITPLMFLISGIGAFASIWRISPQIAGYLVILGAGTLAVQVLLGKWQRKVSRAVQKRLSDLLVVSNELYNHNLNIRLMHLYDGLTRGIRKKLAAYAKVAKLDAALQGSVGVVGSAASLLQYVGVIVISFGLLGKGALAVEDIVFCIQMSGLIVMMFTVFGSTFIALQRSLASFERVDQILSLEPENLTAGLGAADAQGQAALSIQGVSIRLNEEKSLLIGQHIEVPMQGITALCGVSGGGKSSLCKTLLGFYPYDGQISFMGKPLKDYGLATLRRSIAYVAQSNLMISGTIRENLTLGCVGELPDQMITDAAKAAQCWEWIEALPDRAETKVAEGGLNLSGGQRQQLAIARALLRDTPVIVLDETLLAVDKSKAGKIVAALKAGYGGKAVILVTHEPELMELCDCCYEISGGA